MLGEGLLGKSNHAAKAKGRERVRGITAVPAVGLSDWLDSPKRSEPARRVYKRRPALKNRVQVTQDRPPASGPGF
jgi:hypothetical protein